MKVCFVTAVWKRPEIFQLFAKGINNLKYWFPDVEIEVAVSGSEGYQSEQMVKYHGFHYVETPNTPLGAKMNKALQLASKTNADYYILVGSDDIVHHDLFAKYLLGMKAGFDYIYLIDCYFYNNDTQQSMFWKGYLKPHNRGDALGAGRVLSKQIMQKIGWKCWYDVKLSHVLDTAFDRIVEPVVKTRLKLSCAEDNVHILDIKSHVNMTKFQLWENTDFINSNYIRTKFSYLWKH